MMYRRGAFLAAVAVVAAAFAPVGHGASTNFVPDVVFTGSSLTGWQPIGESSWRAENGEIIGTPKGAAGGWLLANRSYQDVAVFASFRCAAGCQTGVLLRAERTADGGVKGVFVSLNEGDLAAYRVTLDRQGNQTSKERLRGPGGGQLRVALPPTPPPAAGAARAGGPPGLPPFPGGHRVADSTSEHRPAKRRLEHHRAGARRQHPSRVSQRPRRNQRLGCRDRVRRVRAFRAVCGRNRRSAIQGRVAQGSAAESGAARTGVDQVPDADAERVLLLVGTRRRRFQSRRHARHRRGARTTISGPNTRRRAKSTSAGRSIRERSTSTACSTPTTSRATDGPTS